MKLKRTVVEKIRAKVKEPGTVEIAPGLVQMPFSNLELVASFYNFLEIAVTLEESGN